MHNVMFCVFRTSLLCGMRAQQFVQPKGGGDIRDMNINSENWAVVKAGAPQQYNSNINNIKL